MKTTKEAIKKRLRVSDLLPRIVCVVIATVLWLYVMSNNSPDYERTFSGVNVGIENSAILMSQSDLSVMSGGSAYVDITVTGKRGDVVSYSLDDIIASVDVAKVTEGGKHQLPVSVTVPEGCVIKSVHPSTVEVYVDEISTKAVPVRVNIKSVQYDRAISLGAITPDVSAVTVSGPVSVIEMAKEAVVDLELGTITKSMHARGEIKIVSEDGAQIVNPYLVVSQSSVGVSVPVYLEKELPITVDMKHGYLTHDNSIVTITPKKIVVRADPTLLDGVVSLSVATLDETKLGDDTTQIVSINLPDCIENVSGSETATFTLRHRGTSKKSVAVSNIRLSNPNNLAYTVIGDSVNITFRAPSVLAESIKPEELEVYGELNYSGISGIVQVPLTVVIPNKYSSSVYAIGDYTLTVNIGQ